MALAANVKFSRYETDGESARVDDGFIINVCERITGIKRVRDITLILI